MAFAALFVALGGGAIAAIPDSGGVIHACYKRNGAVRIIDPSAGDTCAQPETSLAWNQRGPAGERGLQGPPGAPGAGGVVARLRSAGPTVAGSCEHPAPVTGKTARWTQAADESDQIFGQVTWRHDNSEAGTPPTAAVAILVRVDGALFGTAAFRSDEPGSVHRDTFTLTTRPPNVEPQGTAWLFESGAPSPHVVTAEVCSPSGVTETVQHVGVNVLGVH